MVSTNWFAPIARDGHGLIAVLHLPPLPGSPRSNQSIASIWTGVLNEARLLVEVGFRALLLENHGDAPFPRDANEPHVRALAAVFTARLKEELAIPIGVNLLRNDAIGSLAAATAAGADFIRVNVLTGVTATDQGLIEGCADALLRYRTRISSTVRIAADVQVKFGTPLYRPALATLAKSTVERGLADALIVTGEETGAPTDLDNLRAVKTASSGAPVLAGSGVTADSVAEVLGICDGVIVGSALKHDGYVENPVERVRAAAFIAAARRAGS